MKKILDYDKLCQHKKIAIPLNIRLGEMINEILNGVNPKLLKKVVISLKKQYLEGHDNTLDTKEKKDHVQMVLDKIATSKYNFAKQNIEEGEKFNNFYQDVQIPLPTQQRNFQCQYCRERYFKTNASLYSHYRSCPKKIIEMEMQDEMKQEREEELRPVRGRQIKQTEQKIKRIKVQIIPNKMEEKKETLEKEVDNKYKKDVPVSSYSFGSDIFYEDN